MIRELTPHQKHMREKYTAAKRVNGEYRTVLNVEGQSFYTGMWESRRMAEWAREQLAVALARMVVTEAES